MFWAHPIISLSQSWNQYFSEDSWALLVRNNIRHQDLLLGVLTVAVVSLLFDLCSKIGNMQVHENVHTYIHIHDLEIMSSHQHFQVRFVSLGFFLAFPCSIIVYFFCLGGTLTNIIINLFTHLFNSVHHLKLFKNCFVYILPKMPLLVQNSLQCPLPCYSAED